MDLIQNRKNATASVDDAPSSQMYQDLNYAAGCQCIVQYPAPLRVSSTRL